MDIEEIIRTIKPAYQRYESKIIGHFDAAGPWPSQDPDTVNKRAIANINAGKEVIAYAGFYLLGIRRFDLDQIGDVGRIINIRFEDYFVLEPFGQKEEKEKFLKNWLRRERRSNNPLDTINIEDKFREILDYSPIKLVHQYLK